MGGYFSSSNKEVGVANIKSVEAPSLSYDERKKIADTRLDWIEKKMERKKSQPVTIPRQKGEVDISQYIENIRN